VVDNLKLQFAFDGVRHQRQIRETRRKGIAQYLESGSIRRRAWQAIDAVASQQGKTFQELADEAFKDLLKKHHQPVGLKATLKESTGARSKSRRGKS
jgi:hypothetical protein